MEPLSITVSISEEILKALLILFIFVWATVLLNTLKHTGNVDRNNQGFRDISINMRVQVIIVAFLFGALIEDAACLGTPAVVTGPLLVAIVFNPIAAATIVLIADSASILPLGPVGTPIIVK